MVDLVGQQFGNYRLQRLLGEGGFAQVYLGEHIHLGSQAAIKVLHNRLGQEDQEYFRSEARTIARLKHPNIVRLLDFGIEGTTPFLVMDYAPHGTLRERHPKDTQMPLETILLYVKQVGEALQYSHDQKLIHRDIKPENMLVGERGEILLSDFGIATIAQSTRYQQSEAVAGTAAYMAPEQFQGKPRPASDQYALGIVIYEWLTGTRPFHGSFLEISGQHLYASPSLLQEKLPGFPPTVEHVVLTALAKDPKDRFSSMQAFTTAFEQACQEAGRLFAPTIRSSMPTPSLLVTPTGRPTSADVTNLPPTIAVPLSNRPSGPISTPAGPAHISIPQPDSDLFATPIPEGAPKTEEEKQAVLGPSRRDVLVVGGMLLGLAAVGGGVVWAFTAKPTPSYNPGNFKQAVTTDAQVTEIHVGTGLDGNSNVIGEKDTFNRGETVFVGFTVDNSRPDYSVSVEIDLMKEGVTIQSHRVGANPGIFSSWDKYKVEETGIYEWQVSFGGSLEGVGGKASITFQVV